MTLFSFFFIFIFQKIVKCSTGFKPLVLSQVAYTLFILSVPLVNNPFIKPPLRFNKFSGLVGEVTLLTFFNRLQKQGSLVNRRVFENFLIYVKWKFHVNPLNFLTERFFLQYDLPFYLEVVTFSNRNYLFPEPFSTASASRKFFIKKFGLVIRKRTEGFYLNKIFTELLNFFNPNQQSYLRDSLDSVMHQGLENRAYVHYRWLIRK
jgi:hypothetical protein